MEGVCLEEFDQFFIPLSQKSCYSADPPSAGDNVETKMQTRTFFFLDCQVIKGYLRELHSVLQDNFNCEFS